MDTIIGISLAMLGGILVMLIYQYRQHSDPLKQYPGPWIAKHTRWYTAYFDLIKHGALVDQLIKLHNLHGPIVRIGPNELSFASPDAFHDIFSAGSKFSKEPNFYRGFNLSKSTFGCINSQESKFRRGRLGPFFSRRAVTSLGDMIYQKVERLAERLQIESGSSKSVNLFLAFRCTSLEIITTYCLGWSSNSLEAPRFEHPFLISLERAIPAFWLLKYLPALAPFLMNPPDWLFSPSFMKPYKDTFYFRRIVNADIERIQNNPDLLVKPGPETIYHHILGNNQTKVMDREELFQEILASLLAGSDTVGNTCTTGFFHVISNHDVCRKLVDELDNAWPDPTSPVDHRTLEKLPYLTAVIKESLRISHGVVSPIPRIIGEDSCISGEKIPAGTIVSMSPVFVHLDEAIFPDPYTFNPERWMDECHKLDQWLVSFSRAIYRKCSLAWHELYIIFGCLFRKLEFTLDPKMSPSDYQEFDAFFVPMHRGNQLQVQVRSRG